MPATIRVSEERDEGCHFGADTTIRVEARDLTVAEHRALADMIRGAVKAFGKVRTFAKERGIDLDTTVDDEGKPT